MLRMVQGIDQRLDALLCGGRRSDEWLSSNDEAETAAFVLRIENLVIERVLLQNGNAGDYRKCGEVVGEEYRMDYNELKDRIADFEKKCESEMMVGQCWEYFYPEFMKGIANARLGPIRTIASEFIDATARELKTETTWELIGRKKSSEYVRLRDQCLSSCHIPGTEFDERIKKYIVDSVNGSLGTDIEYYEKFKKGIDAANSESTQARNPKGETTNAFVMRIENLVIARVRLEKGDQRNIPAYGEMMGTEYRMDYNELKGRITDFERNCRGEMTLGQCWEYFYPRFMIGVASNNFGPIRTIASAFIDATAKELKTKTTWELIGKRKSREYFDLRDQCLSYYHVPGTEFDERIKKYIVISVNGSSGTGTGFYEKFKKGVDAANSERTQAAWNPDEYMGESDRWPDDLEER